MPESLFLLKRDSGTGVCFPVYFEKFVRISFLENTSGDCFNESYLPAFHSFCSCCTTQKVFKITSKLGIIALMSF